MSSFESAGTAKARELIGSLNLTYPLNVFRLLQFLNFDKQVLLFPANDLPNNVSAIIMCHPHLDHHFIAYNASHNIERIRFSIAHEIGHLVLEHKYYSIGENEEPAVKKEADDFATEILMPSSKFINSVKANLTLDPVSLVLKLRDKRHFWVSLEATCRRMIDLGLFEGAFILYNYYGRQFFYASENFEPCEETAESVNRLLVDLKSSLRPNTSILSEANNLFISARKFASGQILAAITADMKDRYNIVTAVNV